MRQWLRLWVWLALASLSMPVLAGGPFLIDHRVNYDDSGIWKRSYQKDLAAAAAVTTIAGVVFT